MIKMGYLAVIILVLSMAYLVEGITEEVSELEKMSPKSIERLRNMFRQSHKLATDGLIEFNVMRHLKDGHVNPMVAQNDARESRASDSLGNLDLTTQGQDNFAAEFQGKQGETNSGSGKEFSLVDPQSKETAKSDARQSSFLSSFKFPPNPMTNPLGSNSLMPNLLTPLALPSLPSLPIMTPRPSRPPKSSIIGNNGGSMALTNDNVVVVNVLSNNYR